MVEEKHAGGSGKRHSEIGCQHEIGDALSPMSRRNNVNGVCKSGSMKTCKSNPLEDPHRKARLAAVLAILGALDLPLVIMATRWFRGIHPAAPKMEPAMRAVLLTSVVAFSALFATLVMRRRAQLHLAGQLAAMEEELEIGQTGA